MIGFALDNTRKFKFEYTILDLLKNFNGYYTDG